MPFDYYHVVGFSTWEKEGKPKMALNLAKSAGEKGLEGVGTLTLFVMPDTQAKARSQLAAMKQFDRCLVEFEPMDRNTGLLVDIQQKPAKAA